MDHSPRYRRLRRLLRKMRKEAGLSQVELAGRLRKPQSFVSKAELGERSLDIFQTLDICHACGVAPERFISLLSKSPVVAPRNRTRRSSPKAGAR